MTKIFVSKWQILLILEALVASPSSAFSPLGMLKSHLGSLYTLKDQLYNLPSGRQVPGSLSELIMGKDLDPTPRSPTTSQPPSTTPTPLGVDHYAKATTENSVLGSLFELGAIDITVQGSPTKKNVKQQIEPTKLAPLKDIMEELSNMTFLPLVPMDGSSSAEENHIGENSDLLNYLDGVRSDAWGQFKSLALGYTNWLDHEYEVQHLSGKLPLNLINKVLSLGDRVNFLHLVGKRVDPGLTEYIGDQLKPLLTHFESVTASRMLGGSVSNTISGIVRDAAWKAIHQFVGHVLKVAENYVTREDLEKFSTNLAKTSPMAAKGLDLILNGPLERSAAAEGRSLMNRKGYSEYHDGYGQSEYARGYGYGGYGAYDDSYSSYGTQPVGGGGGYGSAGGGGGYGSAGGGGGYGSAGGGGFGLSGGYASGIQLDPYLILGGLGASVLLAFLAYRIIVTTEEEEDDSFGRHFSKDLYLRDLSDVPSVVHSIYSMLEDTENKYKSKRSLPLHQDDSDDLVQGLNSLWWEHENYFGCVRCSLFNFLIDHGHADNDLLRRLAVAGVAHLLGAERSGQLLDEVTGLILEGRPATCEQEDNTCTLK
ncbi:uncharacterized protein LOC121866774 [Homarus americanus]|uniref:uncharacterized protein LOC121866774 n=1 Tax=Homarus americanus TaxID=6706 RepID=UPI001C46A75B|nr:uncharacterized protein LOC121866774 [Homarus americanus]